MGSFDIDKWFVELPDKSYRFFTTIIEQPVAIAIFLLIGFFIWRKFKLGSKLYAVLHKFFKLVRVTLVVVIVILIASFIQYRQNSTVTNNNTENNNVTIKETRNDNVKNTTIVANKKEDEFIEEVANVIADTNEKVTQLVLDTTHFNEFIMMEPEETITNQKVLAVYEEGVLLYQQKNYKKSINNFAKIMRSFSSPSFLYCFRGLAYFHLQSYKEALFDFDYAIQINPGAPELYNNRALVYAKQNNFEAAIKDFNIAIFLDANLPKVYINRGYIHYLAGSYDSALDDWKRSLSLNRDNTFLNAWIDKILQQK